MGQKRVHKRLQDLVEVEFTSMATDVTMIIKTKTRDISAGGVKVYLNHQFVHDEIMKLKIKLPNNKIINTEAVVIDSEVIGVITDKGEEHLYETRFKFPKMDPDSKNEIIHYIYNCRKQEQDAAKSKEI